MVRSYIILSSFDVFLVIAQCYFDIARCAFGVVRCPPSFSMFYVINFQSFLDIPWSFLDVDWHFWSFFCYVWRVSNFFQGCPMSCGVSLMFLDIFLAPPKGKIMTSPTLFQCYMTPLSSLQCCLCPSTSPQHYSISLFSPNICLALPSSLGKQI